MSEKLLQVIVIITACSLPANIFSISDEESCVSYGPGVYPDGHGSKSDGHQLQYTKAVSKFIEFYLRFFFAIFVFFGKKNCPWFWISVSRPAPHFEGTAVINGEFTQLSLTDYLRKYVVFFFYPLDLWVVVWLLIECFCCAHDDI